MKPEVAEIPGSEPTSFRFFPDINGNHSKVPYVHFLHRFRSVASERPPSAQEVFDVYISLVKRRKETLGLGEDDMESLCPHNVLLVKEWIIVIPRRTNSVNGVGAKSAGMLGMPTVSSHDLLRIWTDAGPANVLRQLGVSQTDT